jgi:hypothetical protein
LRLFFKFGKQIASAVGPFGFQHVCQRFEPFGGLRGIDIRRDFDTCHAYLPYLISQLEGAAPHDSQRFSGVLDENRIPGNQLTAPRRTTTLQRLLD